MELELRVRVLEQIVTDGGGGDGRRRSQALREDAAFGSESALAGLTKRSRSAGKTHPAAIQIEGNDRGEPSLLVFSSLSSSPYRSWAASA